MSIFKAHGEYLGEVLPYARRLAPITEEGVQGLLDASPYAEVRDNGAEQALHNKGFVLAAVREGCAILAYLHDGEYALYTAPAARVLNDLKLPEYV